MEESGGGEGQSLGVRHFEGTAKETDLRVLGGELDFGEEDGGAGSTERGNGVVGEGEGVRDEGFLAGVGVEGSSATDIGWASDGGERVGLAVSRGPIGHCLSGDAASLAGLAGLPGGDRAGLGPNLDVVGVKSFGALDHL